MRAIVIERFGGPDSLVYREMPEPEPMAGHVVIEVKAFGINHVSTLQEAPMPHSDTGERVTPVLDFPSRDGLAVHAVRVDYASEEVPASFIAFFVLGDGEYPTVDDA
jgi:hypothetical protein